jgi:flagellar biosynthesis/type III secretory pathway ATPase
LLATYREVEDLVQIGAYARGSNPVADAAIELQGQMQELLRQGKGDDGAFEPGLSAMVKLAKTGEELIARSGKKK